MFIKSFSSANPYEKISKDVIDPKTGALMRVQGEIPKGYSVDASGRVIPKAPITTVVNGTTVTMDYADQELARLQSTNPELLGLIRKQSGFAGENMSDKDLVKFYIDNKVVAPVSATQLKNKDELSLQSSQASSAAFKVSTQQQEFDMDMRIKEAQERAYNSKATNNSSTSAPLEYAQGNMYDVDVPLTSGKTIQVTGAPLGKNIKLSIGNQQAIVTDIAKSKSSGDIWAKVLVDKDDNFLLDASDLTGATQTWRKVKNPNIFKKTINRTIQAGGFANKEKPYAQALVDGIFNLESKNLSSIKAATTTTTKSNSALKTEITSKTNYGNITLKGRKYDLDALAEAGNFKSKEETIKYLGEELNK
jgi:hypothetical protein